MKPLDPSRLPIIVVILTAILSLPSQPQSLDRAAQQVVCHGNRDLRSDSETRYHALREIEDPSTHERWLLIRDLHHSAGPALLVRQSQISGCTFLASGTMNSGSGFEVRMRPLPVIHAGDRVILSEHTKISDAELEATALEPAALGDLVRVRLKFSGFTLLAIAAAQGRATLTHETSGRRR